MKNRITLLAATGTAVILGCTTPAFAHQATSHHQHATTVVRPGHSIQAAIDAAKPRSTVEIRHGIYRENLLIDKPLTLRGRGNVVLEPSARITSNPCTDDPDGPPGFDVGVCVVGKLGAIPPGQDVPTVISPVAHVRLIGMTIRHFTGGVITLGTRDLRIAHVATDNGGDGIFAEQGTRTSLVGDSAHHNDGAGLQIRSTRTFHVAHNISTSNDGEGLLVLDSRLGGIRRNTFSRNCVGIAAIDSAAHGATGKLRISNNRIHANDLFCPGNEGQPSESGVGIGLVGTASVLVTRNSILRNVASTDPSTQHPARFAGGGVLLMDGSLAGGAAPTHNRIAANTIEHNHPWDVLTDGSGSANTFSRNRCATASTPGICDR